MLVTYFGDEICWWQVFLQHQNVTNITLAHLVVTLGHLSSWFLIFCFFGVNLSIIFRRFLSMTAKMNFDFDWILWFLIQNYVSAQNSFYHINNINFMMLHYYVIINSNWSKCVYISLPMVKIIYSITHVQLS